METGIRVVTVVDDETARTEVDVFVAEAGKGDPVGPGSQLGGVKPAATPAPIAARELVGLCGSAKETRRPESPGVSIGPGLRRFQPSSTTRTSPSPPNRTSPERSPDGGRGSRLRRAIITRRLHVGDQLRLGGRHRLDRAEQLDVNRTDVCDHADVRFGDHRQLGDLTFAPASPFPGPGFPVPAGASRMVGAGRSRY